MDEQINRLLSRIDQKLDNQFEVLSDCRTRIARLEESKQQTIMMYSDLKAEVHETKIKVDKLDEDLIKLKVKYSPLVSFFALMSAIASLIYSWLINKS